MKFHLIAAAAMLSGSTALLAQEAEDSEERQTEATVAAAAQTEIEPEAEEEDPGQEVICRTERITGSLTRRRRTCMTRDEWNGVESRTRDGLNRMGQRASGGVECRQGPMGGC